MKKCMGCESILPLHYTVCPKCQHTDFSKVIKKEPATKEPVLVTKDTTFGANIMACHSHVRAE